MSKDPMTAWMALTRQAVETQGKTLGAARKGLGVADAGLAMQRAMTTAADANMAAWRSWMALWGVK